MESKTKEYAGIDVFRVVAAVLVAAIHISPLASYNELADMALTKIAARTAVPFFFMTTGFFLLGGKEDEMCRYCPCSLCDTSTCDYRNARSGKADTSGEAFGGKQFDPVCECHSGQYDSGSRVELQQEMDWKEKT